MLIPSPTSSGGSGGVWVDAHRLAGLFAGVDEAIV
jgi:hypothetical protein